MKLTDIIKKTDAELIELIKSSRAELATAIIDSRTKEIRDTKQIGRIKTTLARALTIDRERTIAKEEATQ